MTFHTKPFSPRPPLVCILPLSAQAAPMKRLLCENLGPRSACWLSEARGDLSTVGERYFRRAGRTQTQSGGIHEHSTRSKVKLIEKKATPKKSSGIKGKAQPAGNAKRANTLRFAKLVRSIR